MGRSATANNTYSIAMGDSTLASGLNSTATGHKTKSIGAYSTAMGHASIANNDYSTAIGYIATANGIGSVSIGNTTTAGGPNSLAVGYNTVASGASSTAMGNTTNASGVNSFAMGYNTTASGDASTAMGNNVSTSGKNGSFIIGDNSTGSVMANDNPNQMAMRFDGGYAFRSDAIVVVGVQLPHGANAWTTISDKKRKENFASINGEDFLNKIDQFNLVSWNYKGQDTKTFRHYGPMAQEFYAAFGKDRYGTIGNDTTINQADFDGINLIAIQALEKRTNQLKIENEKLKNEDAALNKKLAEITELRKENEILKQAVAELQTSFNEQQKQVVKSLKQLEALAKKQTAKELLVIK
jgi:hypothetical protein